LAEIDATVAGSTTLAEAPIKGFIHRVRADVTAGTSINQVSVELRESTAATGLAVAWSSGLVPEPLDERLDPPVYYELAADADMVGTLFVAVAVDDTVATDYAISVQLDIEPCTP